MEVKQVKSDHYQTRSQVWFTLEYNLTYLK